MKKQIDQFSAASLILALSIPLSVFLLLPSLQAQADDADDASAGNAQVGVEFAAQNPAMQQSLTQAGSPAASAALNNSFKKINETPRGLMAPMWSMMTQGTSSGTTRPAAKAPVIAPSAANIDWNKVPQAQGMYLASPMQKEMWQAAQSQDFEKAIELRDQMSAMRQNLSWWNEQERLESEMQQAVTQLDFERAIEIREEIRTLQTNQIKNTAANPQAVSQPAAPAVPQGPFFTVSGFNIEGNTLIGTNEIMAVFEPLVDKKISLDDIKAAASEAKQLYRQKGYVGAYVSIPPQSLDNGVVSIRITEGTVGQIKIHGNKYFSSEVLQRQLNFPTGQPITYQQAENRLLKLDDHRDIDLKATFVPGEKEGTTDLDIEVVDRMPLHSSIDFNNFGTRLTGSQRYGVSMVHTNLLGNMDELYTRAQFSDGGTSYALDYSQPLAFINPDVRFGGSYVLGQLDLQGDFKALNIEGKAQSWGLYTTMPLYDTVNNDINLKLGVDMKTVQNEILNTRIGQDDLTIANTIVTWEEKDTWGRTMWPNGLHFGMDAFGASQKNDIGLNRAHTGAPFFAYRSQVQRIQYLPNDMAVRAKGSWQLSPDKLPSSEQFQIGGFDTVRGYPQGEYSGDYGAVAGAEWQLPFYFLPRDWKLPMQKESLYKNLRFLTFYDYGTANLRGALPGESSKKDISGTGIGMRLKLNDTLAAQVGWGIPLSETASDGNQNVIYFGVSADLF